MTTARKTTKLTGFAHFAAAAGYSAGGFVRAWKEAAFRQEIVAGAVLAAIYAAVGVDANTSVLTFIMLRTL